MTKYIEIAKTVGLVILAGVIVWFIISYNNLKNEKRISDLNDQWERAEQTGKYRQEITDRDGVIHYLGTENKSLLNRLKSTDIKVDRIESILSQVLTYRDTSRRSTDLAPLLEAIRKRVPAVTHWVDSTKCLTVKGEVRYENDSLKVDVTTRDFNNKSDVVGYWQRRKWKFLFWETRFLGRKEVTAQSFSDCGDVRTVRIEKKP